MTQGNTFSIKQLYYNIFFLTITSTVYGRLVIIVIRLIDCCGEVRVRGHFGKLYVWDNVLFVLSNSLSTLTRIIGPVVATPRHVCSLCVHVCQHSCLWHTK